MSTTYWCERAWDPKWGIAPGMVVEVDDATGHIIMVATGQDPPADAYRLSGLVLPGFANVHSHAFHRALRGRTNADGGTFWTWRAAMYQLAERLEPDSYLKLARAAYAEMAVAGVTRVGEFHYLHHPPGGGRYDEPNVMGESLRQAALDAGIAMTLLDTCYLTGGIGKPLSPLQARFSDGTVDAWAERAQPQYDRAFTRVGAAIHSVRAVPREDLAKVAAAAEHKPLHVHLSEQPAENEDCLAAYHRTPTELLDEAGALSARTTAVHATHVSEKDISLLAASGTGACFCPTTEADLADGIGPARELLDARVPLSLGSDQHAVVDLLAEARMLEHGERLRSGQRGRISPEEAFTALTTAGFASLGWPDQGSWKPNTPADLVAIRMDSPRTAGCLPEQVLFAATAADVHTVVSNGRIIARDGHHELLGDVGKLLDEAIRELWS